MGGPLEGVRVLEFTEIIAGPFGEEWRKLTSRYSRSRVHEIMWEYLSEEERLEVHKRLQNTEE